MAVMKIEYYSQVLDMEWGGVNVLYPDANRVEEPECERYSRLVPFARDVWKS